MVLSVVFAALGFVPQWTLTDATGIRAKAVNGGVRISANVPANACRETRIVAYDGGSPVEYRIVARTKPEDIGKMCMRPTGLTTISHWFPVKGAVVTVRTMESAQAVHVEPL